MKIEGQGCVRRTYFWLKPSLSSLCLRVTLTVLGHTHTDSCVKLSGLLLPQQQSERV